MTAVGRKLSEDGRPLNEIVADALRADIIAGVHSPGDHLAEERLAEEYSVSRNPIREAIRRLESEGFVVVFPNRGATVARMDDDQARELLQVRSALETLAIRLATERRNPGSLATLREIVAHGRAAADARDLSVLPDLNSRFHAALAAASGNGTVTAMMAQLREKLAWIYVSELDLRAADSWAEHADIVDCIATGDPAAAAALMERHISNAEQAYTRRHHC